MGDAGYIYSSPLLQALLGQLRGQQSAQEAQLGQQAQQDFADATDDRTMALQQLGGGVPGYQGEATPGMAWGADQERAASLPLVIRALMGEQVR